LERQNQMNSPLSTARRVVVKIGSALLVDRDTGFLKFTWLDSVVKDIAGLRHRGVEVLVVSSGAIALGRGALGLKKGALRLEESQAAAACGQIQLARAWDDALARHGLTAAQILLSLGDTEQRRRHLNARATLRTLLAAGAVPVINENDTVATAEIRFGDNDRLAARVAQMASADCLLLLSDIDGLYTADPSVDPSARFIPEVRAMTAEIDAMGGESRSGLGRGGMITKLHAARIAMGAGCAMAISSGKILHPIQSIADGGKVSWFIPDLSPATARKQWIGGSLDAKGVLHLDAGAVAALRDGRSLLPAGVTALDGDFQRGDVVRLLAPDGQAIGVGLSAYAYQDAMQIMGRQTADIADILGYRGRDEMVHRDDLVLR
jgi:glutamate 5-kinase